MALFSPLAMFFQTRAQIGVMQLDASIQETHELSSTPSKTAVEDASVVTDNVVLNPKKLTIQGLISKTPLGIGSFANSALGFGVGQRLNATADGASSNLAFGAIATLGGLVSSELLESGPGGEIFDVNGNRRAVTRSPSDVFKYLEELHENRIPFSVQTALKVYETMIMTSLSAPRSSKTVHAIEFTATFEQIKVVRATVVFPSISPGDVADAAAPKTSLGKQQGGTSGFDPSKETFAAYATGFGA